MQLNLTIPAPYVTKEEYARMTGESVGAIRGQLDRGYLPEYRHANASKGKGSTRYVDLTKIQVERLREAGLSVLAK